MFSGQPLAQLPSLDVDLLDHPHQAGVRACPNHRRRLLENPRVDLKASALLKNYAQDGITPGQDVLGQIGHRVVVHHREGAAFPELLRLLRGSGPTVDQVPAHQLGPERAGPGDHLKHVGVGDVGRDVAGPIGHHGGGDLGTATLHRMPQRFLAKTRAVASVTTLCAHFVPDLISPPAA